MLRRAILAALSLALAGCANHVRYSDEMRDREIRDVTRAVTRIAPRTGVVTQPSAEVSVTVDETFRIRRRETIVRLDEETPWLPQNELWEVPEGLVLVPFFIAVKASDKLVLGLIPDDFIESGLDVGFAALNPALNVEAGDRVRGREIGRKTRELDSDDERQTRPLAGAPVVLTLTEGPALPRTADASGRVRVELLELVRGVPEAPPRVLHVQVPGDGIRAPASLELPLSHSIRTRLVQAARARQAALAPGVSADAAAQALALLDGLGFPQSALALEHELRDRQHANAAWLSRLDFALED